MANIPFLNNAYFSAKVGIGTDDPGAKLEISGIRENQIRLTSRDITAAVDETIGGIEFYSSDSGNEGVKASISAIAADVVGSAYMTFNTGTNVERMRILSNGNVGIGTTSPQVRLTLRREDAGSLFELNRPASGVEALYGGIVGNDPYFYSNNGIFTLGIKNPDGGLGGEVSYITMRNGATRYTTFEAGNVGIGTTSPGTKLEVAEQTANTSAYITVDSLSWNSGITLKNGNGTWEILNDYTGLGTTDALGFYNGGYHMVIDNTGKVGIGTVSPGFKLTTNGVVAIEGSRGTYIDATEDSSATGHIFVSDDSVGDFSQLAGNLVLQARVHPTVYRDIIFAGGLNTANPLMTITGEGNVGIGTDSPDYKLDVEGSANNADIAIRINNTFDDNLATSNPTSALWLNAASNNGYLRVHGAPANTAAKHQIDLGSTAGSSFLTFSPGGAERMRIATDGAIQFNDYGAGTLVTDASGNITAEGGAWDGPFLPLAGGTMTGTAGVLMPDNFKLKFGDATTSDLEIYHDGSNSYIKETGTGRLILSGGSDIQLQSPAGEVMADFNGNSSVDLYYNNSKKFETTSTGVSVVGDIKIQAALLSNQDNTDVDTGTETVANVAIATYAAAFFDFVIKKTTNVRSGTVYACHDGTSVVFTETSTNDLGDTSDVTLSVDISGTNMRLLATVTSDDWSVKSLIRAI